MSNREIPVAIRVHTELIHKKESKQYKKKKNQDDFFKTYGKRVLVFDTETTIDIYQNLLVGQAMVFEGTNQAHIDGLVSDHYLFYGDNLSPFDMEILKQFAKAQGATLLSKKDFIEKVFWSEVWEIGTLCVGFNLPFDLSRLAISAKTFQSGKHKDMFELKFSDTTYKPTILVKPIDSKKAFIQLRFPTRPKHGSQRIPFRQGRFIDLKTLVFALTNESHSLDSACKLYQVKNSKIQAEEHGKITYDYLLYNKRDVEATLELYCKVKEEFDLHPISLEAGKAYSPATIGKAYYKALGIKPFNEKQPDFPKQILGYAMSAYYGGRSECHYRNKPIKVFHTDITSMYPSVFTMQDLWSWVICNKFEVMENTEEVHKFLEQITLNDLFQKETWLHIPGLVQILPQDDLLPVRAEYGKTNGYQIGLNYLTTEKPMWYTLADIVSCKILTGKIPNILKAIKIVPGQPQEGLKPVRLRGEISIDPGKDNFFKKVIELRKQVKKGVKQKGDGNDAMQLFLKILANSTSYGVYIEMNREEFEEEKEVNVYGLDDFPFSYKHIEINGKYYNPLIAVMITGAARLILAMMERTIKDFGGNFAFCDTDSMSIIDLKNNHPETIGQQVVELFKHLYPYDDESKSRGASLLEAEDYNWQRIDWTTDSDKGNLNKGKYFPIYCYMVSAKRYVLYNLIPDENGNMQIVIRKKSDHGLGHLKSPIQGKYKNDWVNKIWEWILSQEHKIPYQEPRWFYYPAFAQMSISKPSIYNILNREKKDYSKEVKPFNFMLVAYPMEDKIFGTNVITEYYCRFYKAIGKGLCRNKSNCKYSPKCFANLHIIPITPFEKPENWRTFQWVDKNTKEQLEISLSQTRSKKARKPKLQIDSYDTDSLMIKNYFDFIETYNLHPELKYDDFKGDLCNMRTKGLLARTHINASEIKHIGKETNTLQDKEEETILPDEKNWEDTILNYKDQGSTKNSKEKIDIKLWKALVPILKEKAKPRQLWAEKLSIATDYLKQLLNGRRRPSSKLYEKIIEVCKINEIPIPESKKPIPSHFEENGKGCIFPVNELALKYKIPAVKIKDVLNDHIFTLFEVNYININNNSAKDFLADWKNTLKENTKQHEREVLKNLKVRGICLTNKTNDTVSSNINDVTHFQVSHEVGRSYKTINVKSSDRNIYKVLQKDNLLLFKYCLLPKPAKLTFNEEQINVLKKNGYVTQYSPWIPYHDIPWLDEKRILNLYGISKRMIETLISNETIPLDAIRINSDGNFQICPRTAFQRFKEFL